MIAGLSVHEAAELFPLITGADFDALVADIRDNGQMEPVVLDAEGRIIDGRNRARACEVLNIRPLTKRYDSDDVLQFVISHNLHRRHLSDSQRALIAAKLASRAPRANDSIVRAGVSGNIATDLPPTLTEAAALLNTAPRTVGQARQIVREGTEALQQLVADGHATVSTASRVATELPAEQQDEYVAKVRDGADPIKAAPPAERQREWSARRDAKAGRRPERDEFHRGTRHINPEQVIENTIGMLDGIASGLALVKGVTPTLDAEKRLAWLEALREPLSVINHFKKELAG